MSKAFLGVWGLPLGEISRIRSEREPVPELDLTSSFTASSAGEENPKERKRRMKRERKAARRGKRRAKSARAKGEKRDGFWRRLARSGKKRVKELAADLQDVKESSVGPFADDLARDVYETGGRWADEIADESARLGDAIGDAGRPRRPSPAPVLGGGMLDSIPPWALAAAAVLVVVILARK